MMSTLPPAGAPPTKWAIAGGCRTQWPLQPASSPAPVPCHPLASLPVAIATVSSLLDAGSALPCSSECHHVCSPLASCGAIVPHLALCPHWRMNAYWSSTRCDDGNISRCCGAPQHEPATTSE